MKSGTAIRVCAPASEVMTVPSSLGCCGAAGGG